MSAPIATFVRKLDDVFSDKRLYACVGGHLPAHVVVSATVTQQALDGLMGPETYIFAADEHGAVTSWLELRGSLKDTLDHAEALRNAGYVVIGGAS